MTNEARNLEEDIDEDLTSDDQNSSFFIEDNTQKDKNLINEVSNNSTGLFVIDENNLPPPPLPLQEFPISTQNDEDLEVQTSEIVNHEEFRIESNQDDEFLNESTEEIFKPKRKGLFSFLKKEKIENIPNESSIDAPSEKKNFFSFLRRNKQTKQEEENFNPNEEDLENEFFEEPEIINVESEEKTLVAPKEPSPIATKKGFLSFLKKRKNEEVDPQDLESSEASNPFEIRKEKKGFFSFFKKKEESVFSDIGEEILEHKDNEEISEIVSEFKPEESYDNDTTYKEEVNDFSPPFPQEKQEEEKSNSNREDQGASVDLSSINSQHDETLSNLKNIQSLTKEVSEKVDDLSRIEAKNIELQDKMNALKQDLVSLTDLFRSSTFQIIDNLRKLDNLKHLIELKKIDHLDRILNHTDWRFINQLTKLNLPENTKWFYSLFLIKGFFFDLIKISILAIALIYFVTLGLSNGQLVSLLAKINIKSPNGVNVALPILERTLDEHNKRRYVDLIQSHIQEKIIDFWDPAVSQHNYQKMRDLFYLDQINYKDGKIDLRGEIFKQMDVLRNDAKITFDDLTNNVIEEFYKDEDKIIKYKRLNFLFFNNRCPEAYKLHKTFLKNERNRLFLNIANSLISDCLFYKFKVKNKLDLHKIINNEGNL